MQQATFLLAILIALGAGQAVAHSSSQRGLETCAIVQTVKVRREQHVLRQRATHGYAVQDSRDTFRNDLPAVSSHTWNARRLRAPPLSSIA